jgi:predicted ester cyclase
MPEDNEAVLQRAVRRWNEGDLAGYLELYDAGAVLHGYEGVEPGLEAIRRFYEAFWVAFPGGQLSLDDVISEGDEVACRFTLRATHRGEFNGMPPTGRQVARTGITILRFTGGRCVERSSQADSLGLLRQLGAVPEHAA